MKKDKNVTTQKVAIKKKRVMDWERNFSDVKSLLTGNKSRNKHVFWSMVRWGRWWQQSKTQKKDKHIGLVHELNENVILTVFILNW